MAVLDSAHGVRIEVLGPVEAWVDGQRIALGGQRPRALLAALVLARGRVVTAEQLIDELWGDDPPARAREGLQVHVSRLRRALTDAGGDPSRLASRAGGYVLDLEPGACDIDRWEAALRRARRARAADEPESARAGIEEALGIWRGPPLTGAGANARLDAERARLEEERLAVTIEGIELGLALGHHGDVLAQLEPLIAVHPFKERLVALQMLALYRCGRQADALAAYRSARERFAEELGIEPGQELVELHKDILRHAETLAAEPVRTTAATPRPRGIPAPPDRTIGRERDVQAIGERLRTGSARLLTLTGPGGVGKTRLAQEAARGVERDFADGVCWVSLAAVQRADDVAGAIVQALGTFALSGESAADALLRFLAAKHLLLVVDNVEHVLAAAPLLGELLEACPAVTMLATSREPLALRAEHRHPVLPLAVPELEPLADPRQLAGVDAVALFCDRAAAQDPGFELSAADTAVAELCRRLDGLPLAIELAAARCGLLSVPEIAERLDTAPDALGTGLRDAPPRQQTLRATIGWSHDLLGADERRCFARFAAFAGGATLEAAQTVTGSSLDTLDGLVAKNLLIRRRDPAGRTRLGMLATIRAYADERLRSGDEEQAARRAHFAHYLALAERHGTERRLWGPDAAHHMSRLDAEVENLQAALVWAIAQDDATPALALVAALGCYWLMRDRFADAAEWVDRALDLPGADAHPALCAAALRTKVRCLQVDRDAERAECLAAIESFAAELDDARLRSQALQLRVDHEIFAERLEVAAALADDALRWAGASGDPWEIAAASVGKAVAAASIAELRDGVETAAALLTDVGNLHGLGRLLNNAAYGALCLGSERDATDFAARAAPVVHALGSRYARLINSGNRGLAELLTGDADAASRAFRHELELCREMVVRAVTSEGLRGLAAVAVVNGDDERAATLAGAAEAHRYGKAVDPLEDRLDATFFRPARSRYGDRRWDAAVHQGSTRKLEDLIAYALDETPGAGRSARRPPRRAAQRPR